LRSAPLGRDVAVDSDGWKTGNLRHLRGQLKHLKHQQRFSAPKQKGSNRCRRQRLKVASIHARIAAMRADFLHKTTTAIVQRADVIALDDLSG